MEDLWIAIFIVFYIGGLAYAITNFGDAFDKKLTFTKLWWIIHGICSLLSIIVLFIASLTIFIYNRVGG